MPKNIPSLKPKQLIKILKIRQFGFTDEEIVKLLK